MKFRRILLTVIAVLLIVVFLKIDVYDTWFTSKIIPVFGNGTFEEEMDHMSLQDRMAIRYQTSYSVLMETKGVIEKANAKGPLVLLPPNDYLKANTDPKAGVYTVPEPIVSYDLSGLKTVIATSPNVMNANWAIIVVNKRLNVVQLDSKDKLKEVLNMFKNYKYTY